MLARLPIAAIAIALLAAPGAASAWNVVKNPDFTGGIAPWATSYTNSGYPGSESYFGSPSNGSMRLQSFNTNDTSQAVQCVDIHLWSVIDFSLRKLSNGESGTGTHPFKLEVFDAAACGGNIISTIVLPEGGAAEDGNPVSGWTEVSVLGTPLPSGAISARVNLQTLAGTSGFSNYFVDHVQVIPVDEIFPDDFDGD
jgi:hypothetical protein